LELRAQLINFVMHHRSYSMGAHYKCHSYSYYQCCVPSPTMLAACKIYFSLGYSKDFETSENFFQQYNEKQTAQYK